MNYNSNTIKRYSVLTVDDVPKNLQILGSILRKENYDVSFASSGRSALSIIDAEKPDIILLDIMMPDMDGYEVCEKLKENPRTTNIPIIFLTAKTQTEDIIKGFELGAVDYVTKPFNASELLARVKTHIEFKSTKDILDKTVLDNSRFFSLISNDVNIVCNNIKNLNNSFIKTLEKREEKELFNEFSPINENFFTANEILQNIIVWSELNNDINNYEKFNLRDIVNETILGYKHKSDKNNIVIHNAINNDINITTNKKAFTVIIQNLYNNSLLLSQNYGGEISVSANINDNNISLIYTDNSKGLNQTKIENILNINNYNKYDSNEINLIISKLLLEKLSSDMFIENNSNKGLNIIINFPSH